MFDYYLNVFNLFNFIVKLHIMTCDKVSNFPWIIYGYYLNESTPVYTVRA